MKNILTLHTLCCLNTFRAPVSNICRRREMECKWLLELRSHCWIKTYTNFYLVVNHCRSYTCICFCCIFCLFVCCFDYVHISYTHLYEYTNREICDLQKFKSPTICLLTTQLHIQICVGSGTNIDMFRAPCCLPHHGLSLLNDLFFPWLWIQGNWEFLTVLHDVCMWHRPSSFIHHLENQREATFLRKMNGLIPTRAVRGRVEYRCRYQTLHAAGP